MWAWVKLLFNPSNWVKFYSLFTGVMDLFQALLFWMRKKAQEDDLRRLEEIARELETANKIEDDNARLKAKAEAAAKLEAALGGRKRR